MAQDPNVRTYDPKQYKIVFGPVIFDGFAEGTFVTITRNGDIFEKSKGADGSIDRINKNATDFAIEITLKQTSLTNDKLSAITIADQLNNSGILPFVVKDLQGTTTFFAGQAWIAKDPDDELADTLSTRVWRIETGPADKFTGGNLAG